MTVLNVAYPFAPVRSDTAGGAEQIVLFLDRILTEEGHRSIVLGCEGSEVAGELHVAPAPGKEITEETRARTYQLYRWLIRRAQEKTGVDLIHLHGIDFLHYLPEPGCPVLVTLHLPPSWYPEQAFRLNRPQTWLHCVSEDQHNRCPPSDGLLEPIPNGVSDDLPRSGLQRQDYALSLGRICPEKGFHHAIDASVRAGIEFFLAGQVYPYPEHQRYFHQEIEPRLDARRRFIGAASLACKRRLLSSARCVLIPSLAPETSSLVAMEAAMCGTPAVAFRSGALAHIVEQGVTGFLVDDAREMADAMARCGSLDSRTIRGRARERFSDKRAREAYLRRYRSLAAR